MGRSRSQVVRASGRVASWKAVPPKRWWTSRTVGAGAQAGAKTGTLFRSSTTRWKAT